MRTFLVLLTLFCITPLLMGATSAINFSNVGNLGGFQGTDWTAYTPTFSAGFGSVTGISFWYRREGDSLEVRGTFLPGAVAASVGTISLPSGLNIDSTKIQATSSSNPSPVIGTYATATANQQGWMLAATSTSTTVVYHSANFVNSTTLTPSNANGSFTNSVSANVYFRVPIQGWSTASPPGAGAVSEVFVTDCNGWGSTNTYMPTFANTRTNTGSDITYSSSASTGSAFTINTTGTYEISYSHYKYTTDASGYIGVSVNYSGAGSIGSLSYANGWRGTSFATFPGEGGYFFSTTLRLNAGDVVRPQTSVQFASGLDNEQLTWFRIMRIN